MIQVRAAWFGENEHPPYLWWMRFIYVITNLINGKVYVGQTKDPNCRKRGHWYAAKKGFKTHLYDSMRYHGVDNFEFCVIEECEPGSSDDRERFWIAHYDSTNHSNGYNSESVGCRHKTLSEETKRKLSEANKGVSFTAERCKNISKSLKGKPNIKNRRENNPARNKAISEGLKGKPLSEAHKRATSDGVKRYMAQRGKWHVSDETRKRMSQSQIEARARRKILIDASHPDAQPKTCSECNEEYFPKKLTPDAVKRHCDKRWCSRKCALTYHNKNQKIISVES